MLIYLVFFSTVYLFVLFDLIKMDKYIEILVSFALFSFITLFVGLRYGVGADFWGYFSYFNKADISINSGIEIGYEILMVLSSKIYDSFPFFVLIMSLITFCFLFSAVKQMTNHLFIPIYIYTVQYLLGGPMGQMRQSLAIVILLFSIRFIFERKFKKFLFIVLLATSIHSSSIVFLVAYSINYLKLNKKWLVILLLISIGVGATSLPRVLLENLTSLFSFNSINSLQGYIESDRYGSEYTGSILAYAERLLIFVLSLLMYKEPMEGKIRKLTLLYWMSLIIFFLFQDIAIVAQRISRPFKVVEIFLYSSLFNEFIKSKYLKMISFLLLAILLYKPIYMILSRPHLYLPYTVFINT